MASCMAEGQQPSHIFASPGFELHHVAVDVMHSGDLGCFQDAIGGLLHLERTNKQWFRNKKVGLAHLNRELALYYAANPGKSKVTPLVWTQLLSNDPAFPTLKACKIRFGQPIKHPAHAPTLGGGASAGGLSSGLARSHLLARPKRRRPGT